MWERVADHGRKEEGECDEKKEEGGMWRGEERRLKGKERREGSQ